MMEIIDGGFFLREETREQNALRGEANPPYPLIWGETFKGPSPSVQASDDVIRGGYDRATKTLSEVT